MCESINGTMQSTKYVFTLECVALTICALSAFLERMTDNMDTSTTRPRTREPNEALNELKIPPLKPTPENTALRDFVRE